MGRRQEGRLTRGQNRWYTAENDVCDKGLVIRQRQRGESRHCIYGLGDQGVRAGTACYGLGDKGVRVGTAPYGLGDVSTGAGKTPPETCAGLGRALDWRCYSLPLHQPPSHTAKLLHHKHLCHSQTLINPPREGEEGEERRLGGERERGAVGDHWGPIQGGESSPLRDEASHTSLIRFQQPPLFLAAERRLLLSNGG